MECIKQGYTVPGDENGRLLKTVKAVGKGKISMEERLATFFHPDDTDFKRAFDEAFPGETFLSVNANKLRSFLKKYYDNYYKSIDNSIANMSSESLLGFNNDRAKIEALNRTGDILRELDTINNSKSKKERKTTDVLLNNLRTRIINDYIDFAIAEIKSTETSDSKLFEKYKIILDVKEEFNTKKEERAKLFEQYKQNKSKELYNSIVKLDSELKDLNKEIIVLADNFAVDYDNVRLKDYSAWVNNLKTNFNTFIDRVFNNPKLFPLSHKYGYSLTGDDLDYNMILDEEYEEDDAFAGVNEESRRYADVIDKYKSYLQIISDDIKNYINSLYNLNAINYGEGELSIKYSDYLGVPTTMNAGYVVAQLMANSNFYSVEDFISSAKKFISNKPKLFGVSQMLLKMEQDRVFANKVFHELANPIVAKTIINLETENNYVIKRSNAKADPLLTLTFMMQNVIKSTIFDAYDISHSKQFVDTIKNMLISYKDKQLEFATDTELLKQYDEMIKNILVNYFPNIDISIIDTYLNGNNTELYDKYFNLIQAIKSFLLEADRIIDQKNKLKGKSKIEYKSLNSSIATISKLLIDYYTPNIELNSKNAKGNQSSDVLNNNFISNILKQIEYGNEESENAGLEKLRNFVIKSPNYVNSPIFFGIYDSNGKEISPGLFVKTPSGVLIHPKAKQLIRISLFNGITNESTKDGVMYNAMTKFDYFMSMLVAFNRRYDDGNNIDNISGYFMRVPSDAPKNFIVHTTRISNEGLINSDGTINREHGLFRGFRQHLQGELNTFIANINNIYEHSKKKGYTLKTNTKGLFDNYHLKKGELFKDGKLVGNVFSFIKLFETGNINVDARIKNDLLLYGEDKTALIDKNGKLNLNRSDIITVDKNGDIILSLNKENIAKIDAIVEEWLKNYIQEIKQESKEYSVLTEGTFDDNTIINTMLNTSLMYMNFDDLFEGDSKFYKNTRTFLKRAKEVQAGGKSYDNWSIEDAIGEEVHDLHDKTGSPITYKIGNKTYTAKNGFRGVTITNTVRASDEAKNIYEELLNLGVNKTTALNIAKGFGYDGGKLTTTNDAQSYITIEEFAARKFADGTIDEYKELLEIVMDKEELTLEELEKIGNLNAKIQVQKNFYFDKQFDGNTRTPYPRQIKNAEFVLIPALLPKNNALRKLYKYMKDNNIDQVNTAETDKAAKRVILTFFDNNGNVSEKAEKAFDKALKDKNNIEDYYYRFLYKQQEVAEHMENEQNKAGIQIMKKIIDNAKVYSPSVQKDVDRLFKNYIANITESFDIFLNNMNWKVDDNGVVVNKDGSKELDWTEFYKRGKAEAKRLGMNSNFMEYFEVNELGQPAIPNWMNTVASKLESIAQSMFNNNITRQTLPGWHAAQITSVGYDEKLNYHNGYVLKDSPNSKSWISNEDYNKLSKEEQNKYKKSALVEIKLPRWNSILNNYSDEEALKLLQESGLDEHIGYRIPTEGKQSICVFKVVGFVNSSQGSTIVVPDEWVAQTGSDFDVDSVYGISYEFYLGKDGKLHKYEYITDFNEEQNRAAYNHYVRERIKERFKLDYDNKQFDAEFERLKKVISRIEEDSKNIEDFEQLQSEAKYYLNNLTDYHKKIVDSILSNKEIPYIERLQNIVNKLNDEAIISSDINYTFKIKQYTGTIEELIDNIKLTQAKSKAFKDFNSFKEFVENTRQKAIDNFNQSIEDAAKKADLLSFDEFCKKDVSFKNRREARNNQILDAMINILKDDTTREENYSRSNFDDLTNDMKYVDNLRMKQDGINAGKESTYNPFTQITYMENAMSGARLKALSVIRDNFNSINSYVNSELTENNQFTVEYDLNPDEKGNVLYDAKTIERNFDNVEIDTKRNVAIVRHNRLANGPTNRNVLDKLTTVYSSQTTAHILDAIKEGSIYNENMYTFGTFKTLIDLGVDYKTAILFLQQPAITNIVNNNNKKESIYANDNNNPINKSIEDIAKQLGYKIKPYTSHKKVMELLTKDKKLQEAFIKLFGASFDAEYKTNYNFIRLNGKLLERRFKQPKIYNNLIKSKDVNESQTGYNLAAFDLGITLFFKQLRKTSQAIEDIAKCSNPDKFGAKQSITDTRRVLENIKDIKNNSTNRAHNVLKVGNVEFLEAIYPSNKNTESAYPYLNAFLKYSTMQSVDINKKLFAIENDDYYNIFRRIETRLGKRLDTEKVKQYKQYLISNIYNKAGFNIPLTIDEDGFIIIDTKRNDEYNAENVPEYWDLEIARINGYHITEDINIEIADINKPTQEELDKFNKLTPLQKVLFIKTNFIDGKGVFDFIYTNEFRGNQIIKFDESLDNIEEIFNAFNNAFFNKNQLIKSTILDLIKYAFVVEGFKFGKGNISKIVTNKVLEASKKDYGFDLFDRLNVAFKEFALESINPESEEINNFIDKFVRSHSEYTDIVNVRSNEEFIKARNEGTNKHGLIIFNSDNESIINAFKLTNDTFIKYIRIQDGTKDKYGNTITTLYKIESNDSGNKTTYFMYPLNLLDSNETTQYSINPANNKYARELYFDTLIDSITGELNNNDDTVIDYIKEKHFPINFERSNKEVSPNLLNDLANGNSSVSKSITKFITEIKDFATFPVKESFILIPNQSYQLDKIIQDNGVIRQEIEVNGEKRTFAIMRNNVSGKLLKVLKEYVNTGNINEELVAGLHKNIQAVLPKLFGTGMITPRIYRVIEITKAQLEKEAKQEKAEQENEDVNISSSSIEFVNSRGILIHGDEIDSFALDVVKDIIDKDIKAPTVNTAKFADKMKDLGVDRFLQETINANNNDIMIAAANYYDTVGNKLLKLVDSFDINGTSYSLDDEKLYEALREHPEEYDNIVKLLLDCRNFGSRINDLLAFDPVGETEQVQKAINKIQNILHKVRNNTKLTKAFDLFYNIYIAKEFSTNPNVAKEYSTNPNVVDGFVKLTDSFGDIGGLTKSFIDILDVPNKQIQAVVKQVTNKITEIEQWHIPKAIDDFEKRFHAILSTGNINWSKLINDDGYLIKPFTEKFYEDREKINTEYNEALENFDSDPITFYKKSLERDKWYAKNVHRRYKKIFYDERNANIEEVLDKAPDLYVMYKELEQELYDEDTYAGLSSRESILKRKTINDRIEQLMSNYNEDLSEKTLEEKEKAQALKRFYTRRNEINAKYFETKNKDTFEDELEYYKNIIDTFDKKYPNRSLEEKLFDEKYQEAYEWIQLNTMKVLNEPSRKAINQALSDYYGDAEEIPNFIKAILRGKDVYDENGRLNPNKISKEDLIKIKELTESKYDETEEGDYLLKNIPKNKPIGRKEYYDTIKLLADEDSSLQGQNLMRKVIISQINKILKKYISSGNDISFNTLVNFKIEDLRTLAKLYNALDNNKNEYVKGLQLPEWLRHNSEVIVNDKAVKENIEAFDKYFDTHNNDELKKLLKSILFDTQVVINPVTKERTVKTIGNKNIFEYRVPANTWRNTKREKARDFLEENIEYVTTEQYELARTKAMANGTYNEWYDLNHYYNPYTNRFEPFSFWKERKIKETSSLDKTYIETPTFQNQERTMKEEYMNTEFKTYSNHNYNSNSGQYNNLTSLTESEKKMRDLISSTLTKVASNYEMLKNADEGFIPRSSIEIIDTKWAAKQVLGAVGVQKGKQQHAWSDIISYEGEEDPEAPMQQILKTKGYRNPPTKPKREVGQTDEEYAKIIEKWNKEKDEIIKKNLELERAIRNKDYGKVLAEYIGRAMLYNAKRRIKNDIQLLIEDLKNRNTYKINHRNNVTKDAYRRTLEAESYVEAKLDNTVELLENWYHRMFRDEYHVKHKYRPTMDLLQNITSAKYMIGNVTGGIANIATGKVNMIMEKYAREYFDKHDIKFANREYIAAIPAMFADMYKETSNNFIVALIKKADVVDLDAMLYRKEGEDINKYAERTRNLLYGLQSGGEHFMQNTVLLAAFNSHRLYKDPKTGKTRLVNFDTYSRDLEEQAFLEVVGKDSDIAIRYNNFKKSIAKDVQRQHEYDTLNKSVLREFISTDRFVEEYGKADLIKQYKAKKDELLKNAKSDFIALPKVIDQLKHVDGKIEINTDNGFSEALFSELRNKVIAINKRIHGSYDKIGAALIEKYWWGSVVMQYHKHLVQGILKRWRRKGIYNEIRESFERGAYWNAFDLLTQGFKDVNHKYKYNADGTKKDLSNETMLETCIRSVKTIGEGLIKTMTDMSVNYAVMSEWEKANVRRTFAELCGTLSAIIMAILMHAGWDDDEIADSNFKSLCLYQADRLATESAMYNIGFYNEIKTTYSSPVASLNGPKDVLDCLNITAKLLFGDEDFNQYYTTGRYRGKHKLAVIGGRNIPIYRIYDRLFGMAQQTKYYKLAKTTMSFVPTEYLGNKLAGRD